MLTDRGHNLALISSTLSSYTHHICLQAQSNLLDEAKGAEDSLLNIFNIAYNKQFKNLNRTCENFPGIDWREGDDGIGLQVTTTCNWLKISKTIDTLIDNKISTNKEIWFLFISATKYKPQKSSYRDHTIKSIAIPDVLAKISSLPDSEITTIKNDARLKLSAWFPSTNEQPASCYIRSSYFTPKTEPSDFITHHNLWNTIDDQSTVGSIVLKQIEQFAIHYAQLPLLARRVIAKTVQHASQPRWSHWKIELSLQELELYLSDSEHSSFDSILTLLENKDLACLTPKNHQHVECGEEIHITYDNYLTLNWRVNEPDYDMFSAIKSYYLENLTEEKLFHAFEFCDFRDIS